VPVVASNRASLPEIAGGAALLIEPDDVAGIADALCRVLVDSDLRADLSKRGLARSRAFSWDATAQATLALYRAVLAR
jgi:glycosyltransferase involved in cell wall biosynthesis